MSDVNQLRQVTLWQDPALHSTEQRLQAQHWHTDMGSSCPAVTAAAQSL